MAKRCFGSQAHLALATNEDVERTVQPHSEPVKELSPFQVALNPCRYVAIQEMLSPTK